MSVRHSLLATANAVLLATLMAAPLGASAQSSEVTSGVIRQAFRTGCMAGPLWTTCGRRLDETVLQGLAHVNWTGNGVKALLAESWSTPDNGKTWIFKLRKGVKWHDGKPFTADDVVFSLNTYADPAIASPYAAKLLDIKGYQEFRDGKASSLAGVTKVDPLTVKVELVGVRPLWVELQQISISMLPKHLLAAIKPSELQQASYWTQNRVGTGPFKWTKYVPDQYIEVARNDGYFLGKPKADRIIYRIFADIPSIVNALSTNEIDVMSYEGGGVPVSDIERVQKVATLNVFPNMDAGLPTYLQFNHAQEYLKDVRVRQAMVYAIDREKIIATVKKGTGKISNTMFPAAWAQSPALNPYKYDPAKAKQLLAAAGWDSSRKIDFIYYYADQVNKDTVTAIQAYLAAVGINIVPRLLNPAEIQTVYKDGSFEMGYFANGQGLDPSLGAFTSRCGTQLAFTYCNKRIDELYDLALSESSREKRAPHYREISKILNEDMFRGWLWYEVRPMAFNKRIVGASEHYAQMPNLIFDVPVYNEVEKWEAK
ncbi:ABC transporter substrate-binding protein [Rhodoferax aquaticus]|uniref:ABC transporter substrate-binding protein n=1 Tax=Rhodoferax aquaticus TaxID=2527691 RepID=A0A515ER15_9BURK|nr:ABC transporter substrate-binding protein [Rhodoferax aquaticus]QDL55101.1 ABC transporter substrate-binding protein [Rhodoferax aquaticus]